MSALAEEPLLQQVAAEPRAVPRRPNVRVRRLSTSGMVWTLVLTVLLAGIVALNVAALRTSIEIGKVNGEVRQLQQQNRALQAQQTKLSSADRISRMARHYGMRQSLPQSRNFITLPPVHAQTSAAPAG